MPYDLYTDVALLEASANSPVRSDEAVQAARKHEGVVEAYELEDNDDGFHCVVIAEHPIPDEREEIEGRLQEIETNPKASDEDREAYLDDVREKAEAASDALHEDLQDLPSIESGEGLRIVGWIRRDDPVHHAAWSPGHPGEHEEHPGLADL